MASVHEIISQTFKLALDPSVATSNQYHYSESLAESIANENGMLEFNPDNLESIILYSLSTRFQETNKAFHYLTLSWNRAETIRRKHRSATNAQIVNEILNIQRIISSYALLTVIAPEVFDKDAPLDFGTYLIEHVSSFPWDFFHQIADRATEDGVFLEFLRPLMAVLSSSMLAAASNSTVYRGIFDVFSHVLGNKAVAENISLLESFNPPGVAVADIETKTILGPFFKTSPIDLSQSLVNFADPMRPSQREINDLSSGVRLELKVVLDQLFFISDKIIRSSSRSAFLAWLGNIIDLNHKRLAFQIQPNSVSSDGFMLNITSTLIRFCVPFADVSGSKIDKISTTYFRSSPVYDISDETKILGDSASSSEFYAEKLDENPNFISHCFYLTVAYLHYGFGGLIHSASQLKKKLEHLNSQLQYIETQISALNGQNPPQALQANTALGMVKAQIKVCKLKHLNLTAVLTDQNVYDKLLNFLLFESVFLSRFVDPNHNYPRTTIALPITVDPPQEFNNLPEYFVEVIPTIFNYLARHSPETLFLAGKLTPLLIFFIIFLRQASFIGNPYVKAKFVEMIFYGVLEQPNKPAGLFGDDIDTNPLVCNNLFPALMRFYIDVERTGASSQFEDKFNTRFYIAHIFKRIWSNKIYRYQLAGESKTDPDFFIRFVALLLNDSTYLLDESLSKLSQIHALQLQVGTPEATPETESNLASLERIATSYVQLAAQTVSLLELFTSTVPSAFVCPELVDRFAAMLDYNLDALVGPKCRDLKVENPEKYSWKPRELLMSIIQVYLNLEQQEEFVVAVARDGRSFKIEIFNRAREIMSKRALMSQDDLNKLQDFANRAQRVKESDEMDEEELGDIPDEFLDPLMFTLMKEPVILPSSKVTVDLATIKAHLLSDAKDPFNRAPLNIDEVVPDEEMKKKIQEFRRQKKESKGAAN